MPTDFVGSFGRLIVLGQQDSSIVTTVLSPFRIDDIAPFVVGIVAILAGCGLAFAGAVMRHRERMAMINQGMHPDDPAARESYKAGKKGGSKEGWADYKPPA